MDRAEYKERNYSMTIDMLQQAETLYGDIKSMKGVIDEYENQNHWISISTPIHRDGAYFSIRFQSELIEWLNSKKQEYQKEFDSL